MSYEFISFVHIVRNQKIRVRVKILIYKGKTNFYLNYLIQLLRNQSLNLLSFLSFFVIKSLNLSKILIIFKISIFKYYL
jgi:hypothetical protein